MGLFVNREGTAIIEFALLAPVFFLLFMGIVELSLIMFTHSVLEGAVAHGARVSKTGYYTGTDRMAYIRSEIMRLSGNILNPSQLTITPLNYDTYENIGQPEPCITPLCAGGQPNIDYTDVNSNQQWDADQGAAGPGIRNRIVLYKVTYIWPLFTPFMQSIFGNTEGNYEVSAVTTVKNEGF